MNSDQEKRMIRYLLGQLPEPEQAEVEAFYFADDDCFAELLAIEDELRDAYVRGELSAGDRVAFERRLLASTQQVKKQGFARTLRQYVMESPLTAAPARTDGKWRSWFRLVSARPRNVLIPALSTSLVLLVAAAWWLSYRGGRQVVTPPSPQRAVAIMKRPAQAPARPQTSGGTSTIAFVLNPVIVRGPEQAPPSLAVPPGVAWVRLEARLEADSPSYHTYRVLLETVDNKQEIWSSGHLKSETSPSGKTVSTDVPSRLLQPGDYILTLRGVSGSEFPETVAEYAFRIEETQADQKR